MSDIEKKLEKIDKKLDLVLEATFRQDERIKFHNEQIDELKKDIIPQAVKAGNNKVKLWIYSVFGVSGISLIISVVKFLV